MQALYGFGLFSGAGTLLSGGAGAAEALGEAETLTAAPLIEEAVTGETVAGESLAESLVVDETLAEGAAVDAEIIESAAPGTAPPGDVGLPPGDGIPAPGPTRPPTSEPAPPPAPEPFPAPPAPPPETLPPPEELVPPELPSIRNTGKISGNPQNRLIETGEPLKDGTGWVRRWTRITEEDYAAMRQALADRLDVAYDEATALGLSGENARAYVFEQMRLFRTQWRIDFLKNRRY